MNLDDLNKWLMIANAIAPLVLANAKGGAKIAPFIPTVTQAIVAAEQIKEASGTDKKASVLATLDAGVAVANQTGKVHLDPAELHGIASDGIDLAVKVVNDIHASHTGGAQ